MRLPALRMFFPSLPWWRMVTGGALWPWRLRSSLAPPASWSNIHTCKENSQLVEKVCYSLYHPVSFFFLFQTLIALSAPLVINSGSACRKLAAATAVLCACLCWVTTWRRSRSQKAMWPWGLPDARMGGPSDGGREDKLERVRTHGERRKERQTEPFTCSESQGADWSPVLCEAH